MGLIHRLPESLANKIAAGEVVQRPSSVVKELVENSIDAGATEVAVVIKNAGKSLIFIQDNGSGMSEEDARIAFERHATSKITSQGDLDRILTLGFRGEALAAISSVAQVELKTRREEDELGTLIRVENGEVIEVGKTACEKGSSIAVKNLFFSVPARRKFLKSNATEFKHIAEVMQAFALSYPAVAFTFSDNDTLVMNVKPGTLEERVRAVYNDEMLNGLLPFKAEGEGVVVNGYVGRPNFARKSKVDQYLFMNGRVIYSKLLSHAVFTGYEHLLDKQSYPPYVLFIEIDPERVDVNVHPAKSEVKFDDEQLIYAILQEATRKTLKEHNLTPAMRLPESETGEGVLAALRYALPNFDKAERFPTEGGEGSGGSGSGNRGVGSGNSSRNDNDDLPPPSRYEKESSVAGSGDLFRSLFIDPYKGGGEEAAVGNEGTGAGAESGGGDELSAIPEEGSSSSIPQQVRSDAGEDSERVGMWQVHNKYIITQIRSGIMIVDQHVAHERILYEQALRSMETSMPMSQQLLFPLEIKVPPGEYAMIRELRSDLSALGFEISLERGEVVEVQGVPIDVRHGQEASILRELIDQYREYQEMGKTDQRDMLAASFACRASIKAGDPLSEPEMLSLIEQLFSTTMPYVCPHGRPVVIRIDLKELDRRFGRTS
ncbi:MAG: DNA mismatch repair endonuclease MutL [Ignavibacteriae bacterium]|nr:DNA mismatch repair endonuclease MutL [Ignavibacteriota bacterium]MCB9215553.1 DNA mismatch repair endonuclease MutL [Ignavibacteria bacterium]